MEARGLEGKLYSKEKAIKDCLVMEVDNDMEDEEEIGSMGDGFGGDDEKKKKVSGKKGSGSTSGSVSPPSCQVEKCGANLAEAKRYHRRHKVCEIHAKAPVVLVAGLRQRFCQQCSRS